MLHFQNKMSYRTDYGANGFEVQKSRLCLCPSWINNLNLICFAHSSAIETHKCKLLFCKSLPSIYSWEKRLLPGVRKQRKKINKLVLRITLRLSLGSRASSYEKLLIIYAVLFFVYQVLWRRKKEVNRATWTMSYEWFYPINVHNFHQTD